MEKGGKFGWILSFQQSFARIRCVFFFQSGFFETGKIFVEGNSQAIHHLNPSIHPVISGEKCFQCQHPPQRSVPWHNVSYKFILYISDRFESNSNTIYIRAFQGGTRRTRKKGGEEVVKRITGMINSRVAVAEARSGGGCREDDKGTNYYNYPRTITTLNCIPNAGECLEENLLSSLRL